MNDNDVKKEELFFKCVTGYKGKPMEMNGDLVYYIYNVNDTSFSIGTLMKNHIDWSLDIPGAGIKIHGRYRTDLMGEADMLYRKFKVWGI